MRLKTLKELVDEFGGELFFNGASQLESTDRHGVIQKGHLNLLGEECPDSYPIPDWAIKKPEVKKLYAYEWILVDDGYHPECLKTVIFSPHDFSDFTRWKNKRQPEFDLEFPNDISK